VWDFDDGLRAAKVEKLVLAKVQEAPRELREAAPCGLRHRGRDGIAGHRGDDSGRQGKAAVVAALQVAAAQASMY
jgi:hypothetical protein